jgi:DNA-binding NtrC family response regulator
VIRLLVVDDEESILFAMGEFFRSHGETITVARTVDSARRALADSQFDVAIMDLRLEPGNDESGLAFIRELRAGRPYLPTIVLTAYGSAPLRAQLAEIGVAHVLSKPQPLPSIRTLINGMLAQPATHSSGGGRA